MIATDCQSDNFWDVLDRLEEFGLTPNQFRVYCHLFKNAVDGVVSESSESIAKVCKLTRITVLRVVSDLSKKNLISCDRTPGKKTVFHLMSFSDWRQPVSEQKQPITKVQSKVVPLRVSEGRGVNRQGHCTQSNSDTCKAGLQVNQIYTLLEAEVPLRGTSALPDQQAVNEMNRSNRDTGSLDEKLKSARLRGWSDSGTWWNDQGQQMVTVNRFVVSVAEFMQRSLDSFDVGRQMCVEGLKRCRAQIERIQLKKQQQREIALAIASRDNELERSFCYGQ